MQNIEENWDMMVNAYEQFTEGEDSYSSKIEWPCVRKMLPDIEGKSVLDLGCGTGRFTFLLEEGKPKEITGIDLSSQMIHYAEMKASKKKSIAHFCKGDISKPFAKQNYDFIFSSTVSHYIKDLNQLFSNIYCALKENGICVLSAMHPVYTAQYPISHNSTAPNDDEWTVRYLDKSERSYIQPWIEYNNSIADFLSSSYHHTFSDYINAVLRSGFSILEMQEPCPPTEWRNTKPNRYDAFIQTPSYLIMKLQKRI